MRSGRYERVDCSYCDNQVQVREESIYYFNT